VERLIGVGASRKEDIKMGSMLDHSPDPEGTNST
jgi:hypothetical protein